MEKQTLATVASAQARGDEPEITISTVALDRESDEVVPEGGDFSAYLRNPVVLFGHDARSLPVGQTTALDVVPGRGIRARWRWLEGDAFARRVRNAFEQGVLRAASIGFLASAAEPNDRGGRRFVRWELLEWSLTPLPANPEAVRVLRGLGLAPNADEPVLELSDAPADVLEFDERDLVDAFRIALPDAVRTATGVARRRLEADPVGAHQVFDVDPGTVSAAIAEVIGAELARIVRETTATAVARFRGRVD